jgi:hypothetical protein
VISMLRCVKFYSTRDNVHTLLVLEFELWMLTKDVITCKQYAKLKWNGVSDKVVFFIYHIHFQWRHFHIKTLNSMNISVD